MNINFANTFQSVSVASSQTTNKAATSSAVTNVVSPRVDVLTLSGQRVEPGTYQRPVQRPAMPAGTIMLTEKDITTSRLPAIMEARQEALNATTAPRVTTYSTYFGDTLVGTKTLTQTWIPPENTSDSYLGKWHVSQDMETIASWEEIMEMAKEMPDARFSYKATYTVDGKVVSEYEGKDPLASYTLGSGYNGYNHSSGEWETKQCIGNAMLDWYAGKIPENSEIFSDTGYTNIAGIAKMLGIENATNKASLLTALDDLIAEESDALTMLLSRKLGKAGLGDVTKKITFAEDKDGNIVIEGNISARDKRKLAQIINGDSELVDRIKTQKARMEIAEELRKDGETDPKTKEVYQADFSNKKFDAARTQLLSDVLRRHGATLDDVANDKENITTLLSEFSELSSEVQAYKDRLNAPKPTDMLTPGTALKVGEKRAEKSDAVRSLLSMHRGTLTEATGEERNFRMELGEIRQVINKKIVDPYNDMYINVDPNAQITKFNMKIDDQGRLSITDVQTFGNDPEANKRAERVMNTWLNLQFDDEEQENPEKADAAPATNSFGCAAPPPSSSCMGSESVIQKAVNPSGCSPSPSSSSNTKTGPTIRDVAKEVGLAMLDAHDAEHGDVKEFKHEIISTSFNYEILSPDADRAALEEMEMLTWDIGTALGEFFGKTMGIENPFAVIFGSDGMLSLNKGSLSSLETQAVQKVLKEVNKYLTADAAGEDTEGMLNPVLTDIAEKFVAMKEIQGKLHDKSHIPKKGMVFGVNG